jgi:hypothetical protein
MKIFPVTVKSFLEKGRKMRYHHFAHPSAIPTEVRGRDLIKATADQTSIAPMHNA